jgi:hypothetical protein
MNTITVTVENEDGTKAEHALDLDLEALTMRESVRLEQELGADLFDRLMSQTASATELGRPTTIRALIFAKLATQVPGLTIDGFDLDLGALVEVLAEGEAVDPKANGAPSNA